MNAKKPLVTAVTLTAGLLALAATFWQATHTTKEPSLAALTGSSGKFGPVIEAVLPATKRNSTTDMLDILDLETGRSWIQPPFAYFDYRADMIMAWIRSNRLDISCSIWPGNAACVTHDMAIAAVERKCWEATTAEELLNHPALATDGRRPRRLLVLGDDRPDTYAFRTGEGTLGMLQIVGQSQSGQGVNIRYKLINPPGENSIVAR